MTAFEKWHENSLCKYPEDCEESWDAALTAATQAIEALKPQFGRESDRHAWEFHVLELALAEIKKLREG